MGNGWREFIVDSFRYFPVTSAITVASSIVTVLALINVVLSLFV